MKNILFLALLTCMALVSVDQAHADKTVSQTLPVGFPGYTDTYPSITVYTITGKYTFGSVIYSQVSVASNSNPGVASASIISVSTRSGLSVGNMPELTISPTSPGTTTVVVTYGVPSQNARTGKVTYAANTATYTITVPTPAPAQNISMNVSTNYYVPVSGSVSRYTIQQDGADASATWSVSQSGSGFNVKTYNLGTATLNVQTSTGIYAFNLTSNLWTPGNNQVVLADVSTTQPEYQILVAQRGAAENYANTIGLWNYGVRRRIPGAFWSGDVHAGSIGFSYNSQDNVLVLEDTYVYGIGIGSASGSVSPTSSGSTGVSYDPDHGTVYGSPSNASIPYSAAMAISGPGATFRIDNYVSGYLSAIRVPSTNLALIGVTSQDDAGYGSSYMGYGISYLEAGSLPGEEPPAGAISVNQAQVQTRGKVNVTWQLQ